jgi:7-carboxy-7-deazaguanine synthase
VTYAVKEIYYTLQGEGANAGRPAVFLRFSGCNLWTGLDKDREKGPGGCSRWCDTNFVGTNGPGGGKFKNPADLANAVAAQWPSEFTRGDAFVVCTGGEPLLQLDGDLLAALKSEGFSVAVESNGTVEPPSGVYWLTISPKAGSDLKVRRGNELKLVFPQPGADPKRFERLAFDTFYLQPMDGPNAVQNTKQAVQYCLEHPQWRLSLQTHKYLNIP